MSRISSKSDSVSGVIFVNVSYEYHYRSRHFNFYTYKPETTNYKCKNQLKLYFSLIVGTTLPRFTSVLTHNRSTISGATKHTQMDCTNAANESQLHEASVDLVNIYVHMHSLLTTPTNLHL